ncbi:MAG: crotonase/enoyl-CoA hydratase family protein [Pseudomonadota bacterium]
MTIRRETRDRVALLIIDRPALRNAVDPATAQALFQAMQTVDQDTSIDATILTGAEDAFCAGFDLKAAGSVAARSWIDACAIPKGWDDPIAAPLPSPMGPARLIPVKPVIAAVEGYAVAGGMELALWADLRVVAEDAVFGVFCRRWGVPLIDGGTVRLPRLVGQGRANDLILTGRPVAAKEAAAIGLAERVCPPGRALETAFDLALGLSRFPQACLRADHRAARPDPASLAAALTREWRGVAAFYSEGRDGAARFAAGLGRGGAFDRI